MDVLADLLTDFTGLLVLGISVFMFLFVIVLFIVFIKKSGEPPKQ